MSSNLLKVVAQTSDLSRKINSIFLNPLTPRKRKEEAARKFAEEYMVTDQQAEIFRMRYIEGKSIGFIADTLGYSYTFVRDELVIIRKMLDRII